MMKKGLNESRDDGKNVKEVIKDLRKRSEKSLKMAKETVQGIKIECRDINKAFKHYTKHWNDYVHPGLMSVACEAVGGSPDDSVPMQVVMLLLTAAADIHDDIIDESKTKYGKPTVFGKFGKTITLLLGDAFLVKALTLLHRLKNQFSEEKINKVWDIIFYRFFELGEAEALEACMKRNIDISPEEYLHIIEKKASTFEAHMRIGALIGGGDNDVVDLLGKYGRTLGVLMSVREDFIDVFEPDELKNRMRNECLPLPILYAFKDPQTKTKILDYLSKRELSEKDAEHIVDIIFEDRNVEMFRNKIKRMSEESSARVSGIQNQKLQLLLQRLAKSVIEEL